MNKIYTVQILRFAIYQPRGIGLRKPNLDILKTPDWSF